MEALIFLALVVPLLLIFYCGFLLYIRPPKVILLQSLLAGLVIGVINMGIDIIAYFAHWWHYELVSITYEHAAVTQPYQKFVVDIFAAMMNFFHVPVPFYFTPIFIYGSLLLLLAWRFWNGKGRWFSLLLLIGVPLFSIVRDIFGGVQQASYQVWENVPLAIIVTIVMWLAAYGIAYWLFVRKAKQIPYQPDVKDASAHSVAADIQAVSE